MDIARLSTVLSTRQLHSKVNVGVMDNVKDVMEQQGEQLLDMLQQTKLETPHPTLGNTVDIQA